MRVLRQRKPAKGGLIADSRSALPMKTRLFVDREIWPIAGTFTISRGSRTEAEVIVCRLERGIGIGRGECVPYRHYGETVESVLQQIETARAAIEAGISRTGLLAVMAPGAARNAVDCALWDLEAKLSGRPVHLAVCETAPKPVVTAVTISLGTPQQMANAAKLQNRQPVIKVKLGGEGDGERIRAVRAAAPDSRIILDANEAWSEAMLPKLMAISQQCSIALIEQPLPAGNDAILATIPRAVPVCADESAHCSADLPALVGRYDCINIKLDKAGGLTEALAMRDAAHALGFAVMIGCMVGTSLGMAPAVLLAQNTAFADLDGPLILANDRPHGLTYARGKVSPPTPALWG